MHERHGEDDAVVLAGPPGGREDVRVLEVPAGLPHEPQEGGRVGLAEHLAGPVSALAVVPDAPDVAHAARAEQVHELVAAGEYLSHDWLSIACRRRG